MHNAECKMQNDDVSNYITDEGMDRISNFAFCILNLAFNLS